MLGRGQYPSAAEIALQVIKHLEGRLFPGKPNNQGNLEITSLEKLVRELQATLDLHLRIAKVRVGLEESTLGASETIVKALTHLRDKANESKLNEEVGRKADSLLRALQVAEQKGLLDALCAEAGREVVPRATKDSRPEPLTSRLFGG